MPKPSESLDAFRLRQAQTLDEARSDARERRHQKGYSTARENLAALCDPESFLEYGQMAVAAQRQRRDYDELVTSTAADGVITGVGAVNADVFSGEASKTALIVNDYAVLAGTQGYFHHHKIDRILAVATEQKLPLIMLAEGGGGRPGDTDVTTHIAGLHISTFAAWAALSGKVPRIAVANGYCFAGNAALFGCADIKIATRQSWIGMAGPAMIEGGGLGSFKPTEIGPVEVHANNGTVDLVVDDEPAACEMAKRVLSYFQGSLNHWDAGNQNALIDCLPDDRRFTYKIRSVIELLADRDSVIELKADYGRAMITALVRIEGRAIALIANDCSVLGGAIDAPAADKAAQFLRLCEAQGLPIVSLADTPGFMVGPDSEADGAVRYFSELFIAGAQLSVPLITVFIRKGYGLGAMAMAGGSFAKPRSCVSWPTGEFGGMGLEGAITLGFKRELDATPDEASRKALFDSLLASAYEKGQATEAAAHLELDAVIDPKDTRKLIVRNLT